MEKTYPVPNADPAPRSSFRMEPEAQLRAMREIRASGLELTGTYHSHPKTPPRPSARDRQLAYYPDSVHLIVSLAAGVPEVRCWYITNEGEEIVDLIFV